VIAFCRSSKSLLAVAALLALSPLGQAQQRIVVPHGAGVGQALDQREGNDELHVPGRYAPSRVLSVYRIKDLSIPAQGLSLDALSLRRDGLKTTSFRDHSWKTTVKLSSKGVALPSQIDDGSFNAAHGGDLTTVLTAASIRYPDLPQPGSGPAPFAVRMKFAQPFVLQGAQALAVEILSESPQSQSENHYWYADFEAFDRSAEEGKVRLLGRGCPFGFQSFASAPPLDGETPLEVYSYTRVSGTAPQFALLWTAAQAQSWGALPLPLDLTPVGASGCRIYVEPMLLDAAIIDTGDPRGLVRFALPAIPRVGAFANLKLYQQAMVLEPSANPLGLRTSNYLEITTGKLADPLPARTLYHSSSISNDVPTRGLDGGLVLEIEAH
jgi:hypothetical protein